MRRRKLYWCSPWVFLALLLNILILLILYYVLRKKVELDVPLSAEGRRQLFRVRAVAWGLFVVAIALIVTAIANTNLVILWLPALCVLLAAAIVGVRKGSILRVAKYKDGKAWLVGAGPEFLGSLPTYVG